MIASPASLPNLPVMERVHEVRRSNPIAFDTTRLEVSASGNWIVTTSVSAQDPASRTAEPNSSAGGGQQAASAGGEERRSLIERMFNIPPMRKRLEKSLREDWKFDDVKPRHVEKMMAEDEEETRRFFLDRTNARQYQRLLKEFGCGFESRNGKVVDDSIDTLSDYGPELVKNYSVLMDNRELIKRYFAGVFRDGRIGTQSLIRISNSVWFGTFEVPKFRMAANILHTKFQVPNHVIGPMLASVGDSYALRQVLSRRLTYDQFYQLLNRIAPPSTENSGNAFAPTLQLLVMGEENKLGFSAIDSFVAQLKLQPKDFVPFSAIIYNLQPYRLAEEIKCPTFAMYLRRILDEFGNDITQESARLFLLSFREYKNDGDSLQSLLSAQYQETRAYLKSLGIPIRSTIWNMERLGVLSQRLTPERRVKVTRLVKELSAELTVADVMFLADIADNEEECKLLLNRQALLAGVKDVKIDRIVERSHDDLVKELEREIDLANANGLYRTVRRLRNMIKQEKMAYTERVDPEKMTNIQLSRLLIFHRSIDMPGFLDTVGWNVSLDLQNERSEGGGYLGYDKDMAMVTMVPGQPGDNRQYRPANLQRAAASLALFHNHAFKDSFAQVYLGIFGRLFPSRKDKNSYAGPSGWVGAKKGDISAAAESELPSFIITKIGYPKNPDGSRNKNALLVNFDWVIVDKLTGEALRSDRGVFTVPYYGDDDLGKLKWPSGKEMRRRERELRAKCPPVQRQDMVVH